MRAIEYHSIRRGSKLLGGQLILDVGSGSGGFSRLLVYSQQVEAVAIDPSVPALRLGNTIGRKMKRMGLVHYVAGVAEALPFKDCLFDRVICSSALEHFNDDKEALGEISRTLDDNGLLVLTTDTVLYETLGEPFSKIHKESAFIKRYYTTKTLAQKIGVSGLNIVSSQHLHNSLIASLFVKLSIILRWRGIRYMLFSTIGLILTFLFGWLGKKDIGFTIIVVVKKRS